MPITRFFIVAALAAIPCAAFASDGKFDLTPGCSGALTVSNSDGVSLTCTGIYYLTNTTLESDKSITVTATGGLAVEDITFNAPSITLSSDAGIIISDNVLFTSSDSSQPPNVMFTGGPVFNLTETAPETYVSPDYSGIGEGGLIVTAQQTPTVPEPGSFALMALGLGVIGLATRKRIKA